MSASGGRRIKRSLNIDTTSIHFLDEQEQQRLIRAKLLKPYMDSRHEEISARNQQYAGEQSVLNERRMTNVGTFRAYLQEYLRHHPRIRRYDPDGAPAGAGCQRLADRDLLLHQHRGVGGI